MFQRFFVTLSIVCCLAATAAAQAVVTSTGQIRSGTYGSSSVQMTTGTPGVRVLSIVGEPIIEPNTGKRLKYLVVDPNGRQIGAVIDSPANSDHGFKVTKADGEIDSKLVNVQQWAIARSGTSNGYANFYGPDGSVRLIVAPGSGPIATTAAPVAAPAVSYSAPMMHYPAAPVVSYPTYQPIISQPAIHYSSPCGCR